MTTLVSLEEACKFFSHIYGTEAWPGVIRIEVYDIYRDPNKLNKKGQPTLVSKLIQGFNIASVAELFDKQLHALNFLQEQGYHFFFTVCFNNGSETRKKEDVIAIKTLWADIDHIGWPEMATLLQTCPLPPSCLVRSGGGYHAYWRLQHPGDPLDARYGAALARVRSWARGDATQDLARLLRVPGTWNFGKHKNYREPQKCEVVSFTDVSYNIDDFLQAHITLTELKVNEDFKQKYILNGDALGPTRSERDYAIIKELIIVGHTLEDIQRVFANPNFGCSDKALEPNNGERYIRTSYEKAKLEVGDKLKGTLYDDGRVIKKKKLVGNGMTVEETLSNFCVHPQRYINIVNTGEGMAECKVIGRGREKEQTFSANAMLTPQSFLKEVGIPGLSFSGSTTDWSNYIQSIFARDFVEIDAVNFCGWWKDSFVTPQTCYGTTKYSFVHTGLIPPHLRVMKDDSFDLDTTMKGLYRSACRLREHYGIPVLGWVLASAFAPFIREKFLNQFPLLVIEGEPGSGKTIPLQSLLQHLFGVMNIASSQTSAAEFKRSLAGSNAYPTMLDEYEQLPGNKKTDDINALIRLSYQAGQANLYERESKNREIIKLTSPLCITASYGVKDQAILDRAYPVRILRLPVDDKDPIRVEGEQALDFIQSIPHGVFLEHWLQQPREWIDMIGSYSKEISGSGRQQLSFAVPTAIMLWAAKKWDLDFSLKKAKELWEKNVSNKAKVVGAKDLIDITLARCLRNGVLLLNRDWRIGDGGNLFLWQSSMHDAILREFNTSDAIFVMDRGWLSSALHDCEQKREVLFQQKPKSIGGKLVKSIGLSMLSFPESMEVVRAHPDVATGNRVSEDKD